MKPYEIIIATRGSALSPTQRHLLTHIALRAGTDGECFASVPTLCDDTGFKARAVQGALKELVALGVLVARTAQGRSTTYTIEVDRIPRHPRTSRTPAPGAPPHLVHPTPAPAAGGPPHVVHPTPARRADDQIQDQFLDQIQEEREHARERGQRSLSGRGRVSEQPAGDLRPQGDRPGSAFEGWCGADTPAVEAAVCEIAGAIRGRAVLAVEARSDAATVRAVYELDPDRGLPALVEEVRLVVRWAQEAVDGRDDLGGVRPNGVQWGADRSRRLASVLKPEKWLERLDAARRWQAAGGRTSSTGPPGSRRGDHPLRHVKAEPTPDDFAALEQLRAEGATILEAL